MDARIRAGSMPGAIDRARRRGLGLTLLEDQQLAGLVMWVPGGMIYLVAGVALTTAWLKALERRARRAPELLR